MEPLISVIVPVYNTERYLRNCLDSICCQTYRNLEIILVNDGSSDGSAGICEEYAEADDRIRVIHKENEGLAKARNTGIDAAHGEYLAFIDSDDLIHERYTELLLKACMEEDSEVSIADFTRIEAGQQGLEGTKGVLTDCHAETVSGREANERLYDWREWMKTIIACGKLFRRELFTDDRFSNVKIYEDEDLIYQILYRTKKVTYLNVQIYFYRRNPDGITGSPFSAKCFVMFEVLQKRAQFYRDKGEDLLYDLTLEREFFTAIQYYFRIRGQEENFRGLQAYARKRQKELYRDLMKKKRFIWKRKLKFTWAVCFPAAFYWYYYK